MRESAERMAARWCGDGVVMSCMPRGLVPSVGLFVQARRFHLRDGATCLDGIKLLFVRVRVGRVSNALARCLLRDLAIGIASRSVVPPSSTDSDTCSAGHQCLVATTATRSFSASPVCLATLFSSASSSAIGCKRRCKIDQSCNAAP